VIEREQAIESGRQSILRLLGEANILKNQLAQIEEYLAGIDRKRPLRPRGAGGRRRDRASRCARKQLSETMAQRQMELELVTGERRHTEEQLGNNAMPPPGCARPSTRSRPRCRRSAPQESLEQVLAHRTYTTESVKRLFAALEKGNASDLKPMGVLADYVEVDAQLEKPAEEFLHDELEYVVVESWQQAERGLDFIRAELDGRATFLGAPRAQRPRPAPSARAGHRTRNRHHRAAERIAAPHYGFKDRAVDLLPRVSLCFLADDRAAAQRLAVSIRICSFCYPMAFATTAHRHRRQKIRGRPAGHEEGSARVGGRVARPPGGAR